MFTAIVTLALLASDSASTSKTIDARLVSSVMATGSDSDATIPTIVSRYVSPQGVVVFLVLPESV